jgi:hypothetical protein
MKYPLVIIHRGYSAYLKWAIMQASQVSKNVVLIGNEENKRLEDIVSYQPILQLSNPLYNDFLKVYEHMSTNEYKFELVCFERWFLLLDYMRKKSLEVLVHLDSDVMLFNDLHEIVQSFGENTLAAFHIPRQSYSENRWIAVAHTSIWTRKGLEQFCSFIADTYKNNKAELKAKWTSHGTDSRRGGISDMALLYLFYNKNEKDIINLAECRKNLKGEMYCLDLNINSSENYDQHEFALAPSPFFFKIKKLNYQDGVITALNFFHEKIVVFESLHCQGKAKILMFLYYRGKMKLADRLEFLGFAYHFFWQRTTTYGRFMIKKLQGKHYSDD